jgi:hypothetical protein
MEELAEKYAQLKQQDSDNERGSLELGRLAVRFIDSISSSTFFLPLEKSTQSSNGTTTYIYQNNATYPAVFDLLAELLHITVPIEIGRVKLGPGEILVSTKDRGDADIEIELATKELQKLVHAKRAEIFTRYDGAAP